MSAKGSAFPLSFRGLSHQQAHEILVQDGFNDLPEASRRTGLQVVREALAEPMLLLLFACAGVYLFLGDRFEALMLMFFVLLIGTISIYQNQKTERALDALRKMSSPRALVIRDNVECRIVGREVVRGDIVVLAEGDRVPADSLLINGSVLEVDESLLTGESLPVRKIPDYETNVFADPGQGGPSCLYSGTLVVKGKGVARVVQTGPRTYLGRIGKSMVSMAPEETPLKRQTSRIVKSLCLIGIFLCLVASSVYALTRESTLEGILVGITLAMAVIPEEFPVVLSVFLALGAWRIAKSNVLARSAAAVETLGAATVLCVDKTGTLTENKMDVARMVVNGWVFDPNHQQSDFLPEAFHELVEFSVLASRVDPFDPMEKAFHRLGQRYLQNTEHIHEDWTLEREYPLSERLLAMSHVWVSPVRGQYVIAAKGAPEAIMELCHLSPERAHHIQESVEELAAEGLRVLAVAKATFPKREMPNQQHDFDFHFLGLFGLTDPIRSSVPAAVQECCAAGIRVVMITGDYPSTATRVAEYIGIGTSQGIMTGLELESMSPDEFSRSRSPANVYARMMPEQKLNLVKMLKAQGEIVAMTGDGVNDAPALREAHIGIAMGMRGSDVAREAADLVLLDDNFASIVRAIRLGRRIFDNLQKAFAYILSVHIPIAGLSLAPVLFNMPRILFPMHVVFLELLIDPACSIVFEIEREEKDVMERAPRNPKTSLIPVRRLWVSVAQGLGIFLLTMATFVWGLGHLNEEDARSLAFVSLVLCNFGLIAVNRSWSEGAWSTLKSPNPAMWWVTICGTVFLSFTLYSPLRLVFHLSPLHASDILACVGVAAIALIWSESVRGFGRLWRRGEMSSS